MTTMLYVSEVEVAPSGDIFVRGKDLDAICLNGDLDAPFNEIELCFSRGKKNEMAYLIKVASNKAQDAKSPQELLDSMVGNIYTVSDAFKTKK